jgi:ABC-type glycerol-3-phosphate transport system substrate-binding protein
MKKIKLMCLVCVVFAGLMFLAGCQKKSAAGSGSAQKIDMVLMVDSPSQPVWREKVIPLTIQKFPEINFISKVHEDAIVERTVKTAFTAGESVDIVNYWPNHMRNFTDVNMALDLTPYLNADPEWKSTWTDRVLEVGKYDGKYYSVTDGTVYPLFQVNKKLAAAAGVVLKDQWTWEEFLDACKKIQTVTPAVFPVGVQSDWACWFVRNGLMQVWDNETELQAFNNGDIPFTDNRVKKVFDNIKALYDNNYLYPGEGALTVSNDQILAAFAQGKIAMLANVNSVASGTLRDTVAGAFDVEIVSWPNMGKPEMNFLLGGSDGLFITANTKNPDKAVEVLKYLTSQEILQIWVDAGIVVPSEKVTSSDPNYALYGKDAAKVYPSEPIGISAEMFDYIVYSTPANYVLYGQQALTELEALRQAAKK